MKIFLKISDVNETIDVDELSREEIKEIMRAQVGEDIFLKKKGQIYGIESIEYNTELDVQTIWLFETICLVRPSDTVRVARIFNEDNAKYYNKIGKVIEIIIPDRPPEKRRHREHRFHFLVKTQLENGVIVYFFDTELEIIKKE